MKTFLLSLLATFFSIFSYANQEDFDLLMGKGTPAWKYAQTREDFQQIEFFRALFEKQKEVQSTRASIPKVLHFIWLGPEALSPKALERMRKWISLHPDWEYKLWVDCKIDSPFPKVRRYFVSNFSFRYLADAYYDSVDTQEKEKLLAYEILLQEGGVYAEHGMVPYKAFDPLQEAFDFYCGLEKLGPSILSSSVIPAPCLIAAKPSHPILENTAIWLRDHWVEFGQYYPGSSRLASASRIARRTVGAFSEGIRQGICKADNKDVIFPTAYFNGSHPKASSYAIQGQSALWPVQGFETGVQKSFQRMIQKDDEAILTTLLLSGLSLLGCIFLLHYNRVSKRKT